MMSTQTVEVKAAELEIVIIPANEQNFDRLAAYIAAQSADEV